ncbi:MAG: 3-dehydroquinate synthase family protein [Actinomycetota bacterium]
MPGISSASTVITVDLGDRSYPVIVGHGARAELAAVVPDGVKRVAVITQAGIPWDVDPGVPSVLIEVPPGESAKTLSVVEDICRRLAQEGFTRADAIVAVGGGVVTDLGGFAASVYHRGIRFVSVATTLLGQVDAAIGGKTGVNLPEGKNLVGAFWQPSAVICDTETLETLPHREFRSGVGEIAKYHFLGGGQLDKLALDERVAACVQIKADVVTADEREGGARAILNYGHTLAHAIETAGDYDLRHGECVAIGIAYVAEVARRLGRIDQSRADEHARVLAAYELPTKVPDQLSDDELMALFARDKKAIDGVTFVLDGPAGVETVVGVDPDVLAASFEAVR